MNEKNVNKLPEIVVLFRFDYYLIGDYRYFVRPSYKSNIIYVAMSCSPGLL
jgi:hypothetical protein